MKTSLFAFLALAFLPLSEAHGVESVLKGFLLGANAGSWNYQHSVTGTYSSNFEYTSYVKAVGVSGGYALMRERGIGFEADGTFNYRIHKDSYESGWLFKLEGNATFGISRVVYVFAGLNWMQDMERFADYSGYGPQGGVAFVFGENWLGKLGYFANSDLGNSFHLFETKVTKKYRGLYAQVFYSL